MTYGENSAVIRVELSTLLRQHRIQPRIGGPGTHTVPVTTTVTEREEIGAQIRRFRHVVLTWAALAVEATHPGFIPTRSSARDPVDELRYRLHRTLTESTDGRPTSEELTDPQRFALVETWRLAARAAALGEHDFPAGVSLGRLDRHQCRTVIHDAAEVTHALVVLDQRYKKIPGWTPLASHGALGRAAATCAAFVHNAAPDNTADRLGWRPRPTTLEGPARPGVAGVLQALHNQWTHLDHFPTALNLKRVLDSQRDLSHQLAQRLESTDPDLAAKWHARAATYTRLFAHARNLGGLLGSGGEAAAEGATALSRLRNIPLDHPIEDRQRQHLDWLFARVDVRVLAAIDHGMNQGLYLAKTRIPAIEDLDGNLVRGPEQRYLPITAAALTDLVATAHTLLAAPPSQRLSRGADRSRQALHEAITHRPGEPPCLEGP